MKKCLIYFEAHYESYARDLLAVAEKMYGTTFESWALFIGTNKAPAMGFCHKAVTVNDRRIGENDPKNTATAMAALQKKYAFDSILIPATHFGRMMAPRLAMRLGVGLVADVTQIINHGDKVEMVRPAFDGKLLAGIVNSGQNPVMMSVRPGVFGYEKKGDKQTACMDFKPEGLKESTLKKISRQIRKETGDIRKSPVLIAGGGGMVKDFNALDQLALRLGGMKAASRKVVDSGVADRAIQVGQSGKIVNPELYMALGIYGSLQHVAGLNRVRHLIAVNTNPNAPICSLADIIVEGDAKEFVRKLIKKIDENDVISFK